MSDVENYAIRPGVIWTEGAGGVFILDTHLQDPRPLLISGGGVLIWQLLAEKSLSIHKLAEIAGADPAEIAPPTVSFLRDAAANDFVVELNSR